jgi:DNA repair ATPase RecN
MNEVNDEVQTNGAAPRWVGLAVALLAAFSLLGLGVAWSASTRTKDAIAQQQNAETELRAMRQHVDGLDKRLEQADERTAQIQGELSVVTDRLKLTQGELSRARSQAKQIKEEYAKQLAAVEEQVKSELAAKADAESVEALNGQVSGVRSDLDATASQLNMARGELGTLIARNSDEISQLRRLGQRDYFEFTLSKKGERTKLGHVMVELRGTNSRRSQFTVALYADDKRLEKKNRAINEPIYFYTRGYRAPLELVVNEVGKNKVVGYVSVPRSASAGTGSGTW